MTQDFDTLLTTACARQNAAEVAVAGLRRPRRRPLRVAVAAVACAALLTTGAAALWPQLGLQRTAYNSFRVAVQGAENAPATVTPVDFGYMPNGFTVTERADPDGKYIQYNLSNTGDERYQIMVAKYAYDLPSDRTMTRVTGRGTDGQVEYDTEQMSDDAARTMLTDATDGHLDKTLVVESKEDITLEEMKGYNFLFYPAADAYYEVTYTSELAETAYRIIQNMD